MEKKSSNSRSSQAQTKTQNNDSKKTQDTTVNKPWPRSNKKRESPNNGSSRNDANRKPPPQKGKSFDKRPKPRGAYHGAPMAGKPVARLEEEEAEVGSVFLPGSKKQNLNHLLNFQYAPCDGLSRGRGAGGRRNHGLVYTNTHKHSKELFLQSNCQFIVKAKGDYTEYLVNPDKPVNWEFIEQINVRVSEPLTCPICLGEVVAGRITRCGHSYCWPCLLHYFALSEDSTRPCPVCFQPINKIHLKSVQGVWQETTPLDSEISMRLMRRGRDVTIVEPVPPLEPHQELPKRGALLCMSEKHHSTLFSKLLTADTHEVMSIINREHNELSCQLTLESDSPEFCFIQEALNLLQKRASETHADDPEPLPEVVLKNEVKQGENKEEPFGCDLEHDETETTATDLTVIPNSPTLPSKGPDLQPEFFYFYQASDGQAVFLEGLEVRILEASWGSLSQAPRELKGTVLRRTSGSVGDEARRRLRCLRHLPTHCPFDMVQLNLLPPYVMADVLHAYNDELEERKRQRMRRAREEKRREHVISQQEQRMMGRGPGLRLSLDSEKHFPAYLPDATDDQIDHFPIYQPSVEKDDKNVPTSSISDTSTGLSFAKMTSASGIWKTRPAPVIAPVIPTARRRTDSDCSEGDAAAPPSYNVSLSEAISAALLNTSLDSSDPMPIKDGKKKKKHKAKILFTTGIQHHTMSN